MSTTTVTFTMDTAEMREKGLTDEDIEIGVKFVLNGGNLDSYKHNLRFPIWYNRDVKFQHGCDHDWRDISEWFDGEYTFECTKCGEKKKKY